MCFATESAPPDRGEEWRLSVLDAVGKPVVAEVLASMYDVSLDKIYPNQGWGGPLFFAPFTRL